MGNNMSLATQHDMSSVHPEYSDKVLTNLVYQFAFDYEDGSGNDDAVMEAIHKHVSARVTLAANRNTEELCP